MELAPITSLISKSEQALRKLKPGIWQHTMLQENLTALSLAAALMERESAAPVPPGDYERALRAFASMIARSEQAQAKFLPGTAQHTLLTNRLEALQVAKGFVQRTREPR